MKRLAFAAALAIAGCAAPSHVIVARYDKSSPRTALRVCTLFFRWSWAEMVEQCGEPDEVIDRAGYASSKCAIYKTMAAPFSGGLGATRVAVCLTSSKAAKLDDGSPLPLRIDSIYGLADR